MSANRAKTMIAILCAVALTGWIVVTALLRHPSFPEVSTDAVVDLLKHPVYSEYRFDNSTKTVNMGTQPLYMPTGLITEALKRDRILKRVLDDLGVKLQSFAFLKGDDVNFFLQRGDLDLGIGGDMPALSAAASFGVVIPTIIQQGFTSIVARKHMLIKDLKGQRIGYAYGSNAHYALLDILHSNRMTPEQVELVPMNVTDMPEALHAHQITAFSAWEPTPRLAQKRDPSLVTICRKITTGYLYINQDFMHDRPEVSRFMVAAQIRAIRWMLASKQNLLAACQWTLHATEGLTGNELGLTVQDIANLAQEDILGQSFVPVLTKEDLREQGLLHRELEFLKSLGTIPQTVDWDDVVKCFDFETTAAILAQSRQYRLDEFDYDANMRQETDAFLKDSQ